MIITKKQGTLEYLVAEGIPVPHAFTTRYGGVSTGSQASLNLAVGRGDSEENVENNLRTLAFYLGFDAEKYVLTRQTHSDIVRVVTEEDCNGFFHRDYPECDALVTNTRSQHVLEKVGFQFMHADDKKRYYRIMRNG